MSIFSMFKNRSYARMGLYLTAILLGSLATQAQTSISGPTCVTSGTQYTYTISGNWNSSTFMSWTITGGGSFSGSSSGTPCPQVHVTWTGNGTLKVTTSNPTGSATISISVSSSVGGGTVSPSTQTINYNTVPTGFTCTAATGGNCSPSYSYQWQQSTDNVNYSNISGATSQNYSPGALTTTTYFRRFVTETVSGGTAYSSVATVTVNLPLSGGTIGPSSQQITTGGTVTQIGGTPGSGGACSTFTYNWQSSSNGTTFTNTGVTTQNYTPSANGGLYYYRRQTNCTSAQGSETAYSNVVTVDVENALWAGAISPSSVSINPGTSPGQITGPTPSGGFCQGAYTYQWQSHVDGGAFANIAGATSLNYTPGTLSVNTYYQLVITCGSQQWITNTFTAMVNIVPGTMSPSSQQINYGYNSATLSISGTTGGAGSYTYQWQSSPDNTFNSPTNVGTNSASFTPTGLTSTTWYRVQVSSTLSTTVNSSGVVVNVWPQIHPGTISPSNIWINYNTAPSTLTLSGVSGGNGTYSYQWYTNASGSYQPISGATGTSYTPPALTATTSYECVVTSNGASQTTPAVTANVYPQLISGSVSPASQTIDYYRVPAALTLSGTSGGTGVYTYQWQSASSAGGPYTAITNATGTSYAPPATPLTTYFEVVTSSNGVSVTSAPVVVNVNPQVFTGQLSPGFATVSSGTSPGLLILNPASGGACGGSFAYQWQSSTDNTNWSNIGGVTGLSYNPGNLTVGTFYRVRVICGTDTEYSNTSQIFVGDLSANLNYIRTRILSRPGITDPGTADGLTDPADVQQTTVYFDGLGRPVQTVARQASPLLHDMVSTQGYDAFGRETLRYLPYTSSGSDGNFKTSATAEQSSFNAGQFPGEQYYYGQTGFEASPLNRVLNEYAPGNNWVGSDRSKSHQYLVNTVADSVQIWNIALTSGSLPVNGGAYAAGTLYKTSTADEQGNQTVNYTDIDGRLILKKVQAVATPGTGHTGWLCTYYVYDNLSNVRYIIQPQGVLLINGSWSISQALANELCFRFEYDARNRLSLKKVPGAGAVSIVYDSRDRMVMTQDSNLFGSGKWHVMEYDSLNRVWRTGLLMDGNNQAYHQNLAYNSITYPGTGGGNYEVMTQTFFDDYSWVAGTGSGITSTMAAMNGSQFITGYNTYPTYAQPLTPVYITRGLSTGRMRKVIGTASQYLYYVNFIDDRGRIIQTQEVNYTGGIDSTSIQYSFTGEPIRALLGHRKNGNSVQNHSVQTKMDYDPGFRLRHVWLNIDNASSDQLIDSLQYNELGQPLAKYLGNKVDSIISTYNIRGWLTGINANFVAGTASHYFGVELAYDKTTSVAPGNTYLLPMYNGTVSGVVWKSAGAGINRKYDLNYDPARRLTSAIFLQNTMGTSWDRNQVDFSVTGLAYDANGNILKMNQRGFTVGGSADIDSLTYTYMNSGASNRLQGVVDAANVQNTQLGDFHYNPTTKQTTDYTYDGNGNMMTDNNKVIDKITYNFLNLPQLVHVNGKGNINYVYDASGVKLAKVISDSLSHHSTTTLYIGLAVYQQCDTITNPGGGIDTLQFILHDEGRARWTWHKYTSGGGGYGFEYDFFEKDHLGNPRVLLSQQRDTINYLASMESAYRTTESQVFANIPATSYPRASVPGYPQDFSVTNPNDSVAKVDYNGTSGQKTGPSLLLKVMSGDTVKMAVQSFYNTGSGSTNNSSFTDVLNSLATGLVNATGGIHGGLGSLTTSGSSVYTGLTSFMNTDESTPSGYPKAYLNWIFLDDQFNYISSLSGAVQAASTTYPAGALNSVAPGAPLILNRSGYLYIWVSNETQGWDVFFDNLSAQHLQGPMLEESHYYPFGLTMAGISDKAVKYAYTENRYKFNGGSEIQSKEFNDGDGLNWYDAGFRNYDPQLGKFLQIDPISPFLEDWSPYVFCFDNPLQYSDESGMEGENATAKKPKPKKHKKQVKTLETVIVIGYKDKDKCKTCSPRSTPKIDPGPPKQPPVSVVDDVGTGARNLKEEAEKRLEKIHEISELTGKVTDWGEKLADIAEKEKIAKSFHVGNLVATGVNLYFDIKDKNYVSTGLDVLSVFPRTNPYVFTYETVKMVMTSDMTLSGAALDAQNSMEYYLGMSAQARRAGDDADADAYWAEASRYEKIRNSIIAQLREKHEPKPKE